MKRRLSKTTKVLVTAVGGGGHGEQILKALLHASDSRLEISAADMSETCPQLNWVQKKFRLPPATASGYLEELLAICDEEDINALFHGCEPELRLFSRERKAIEDAKIFLPINPASVIETGLNKARTSRFLEQNGFEPPVWTECENRGDIFKVERFPVVVKPSVGGGGSANCFIAQDRRELEALADYLHLEEEPQSFILQEYVGRPDQEYTVGVLHDLNGNFLNSIAVKRDLLGSLGTKIRVKNRTERTDLGENLVISTGISQGIIGHFPEVTETCERIAARLDVRGAINIQCRLVDGVVKVFEINPRFSGTTSLRAMVGYNEPHLLIRRHLFGEDIKPRFDYKEGRIARGLYEEFLPEPV
ncbi:MAG: ATP-grasp domain-containing protein [Verrucomicrobiales bacterium]